ncbi:MAG: RNA polymerase sigma factor [Thermoleophilia bacterium]|nr:RNA polymerase sigma factor [Thermoleophilia bacterium]
MSDDHPSTTDAELLRGARRDPDAFDTIYVRHARDIQRWLRGQVDTAEDAWELTAETFAQAWISRRRFRPEDPTGSAAPWLHGIARNVLRHSRRRRRAASRAMRRLGMQLDLASPRDEDADLERIVVAQLGGDLHRALAELPPAQRDAVQLRVIDELSYEQVAERLQCTEEAARMRVMRGLRTLKSDLAGRYR